jgi:hypothetical protein
MASTPNETRDPQLAGILRTAVDAPPLRRGFHDELEARLAPGTISRSGPATGARTGTRGPWTRRVLLTAAVVAVAGVFAFAVLPALRGTDTATAADVLAAMTAAPGRAHAVRMHTVTTTASFWNSDDAEPFDKTREEADLIADISGNTLSHVEQTYSGRNATDRPWHAQSRTLATSYDAAHHEGRAASSGPSTYPGSQLLAPGLTIRQPAWQVFPVSIGEFSSVDSQLTARIRVGLAESDPALPVQETTYLGRPAWRGAFTVTEHWGTKGQIPVVFRWDATVDKETGLLIAADCRWEPEKNIVTFAWSLKVTELQVDPDLEPGWQLLEAPGPMTRIDEGTHFGSPDEVAELSWPTLPLIPQWAPAGYRLTDLASAGYTPGTAPWSPIDGETHVVEHRGDETIKQTQWIMEGQTVLERFRSGFSAFEVEITPKKVGEHIQGAPDVVLTGGYLSGQPAVFGTDTVDGIESGIDPPSLVTYSERSLIVITGPLTQKELVAVANSMKVCGDEDRPLIPGYGD